MLFDYFYEGQSGNFLFYRIPKVICTDEYFRKLSSDAKLLYSFLLDRIQLSKRNHWVDERGRVYVYMTIKNIENSIGCCHQRSIRLLNELEEIGLIERQRSARGKPTCIYVKNFAAVCETYQEKCASHTQGSMTDIPRVVCETDSNNNKLNNTNINDIHPRLAMTDVDRPLRIHVEGK